jgi:hypothetical protein
MKRHRVLVPSRIVHLLPLLCAVSAALLCTRSAQAGFIINVESVSANAGSSGNTLEVTLTNTGSAQTIAGFSFGISTGTSNIDFTQATISTTPDTYIFAGDTLSTGRIDTSNGQALLASDFSASGNGTSVGMGATFGLGEVSFNVAPGTSPGPITVTLNSLQTSLSDPSGTGIPATLNGGTITVNSSGPSPVPEPSTLLMAVLCCPAGLWMAWRQRIAAARAARHDAGDSSARA